MDASYISTTYFAKEEKPLADVNQYVLDNAYFRFFFSFFNMLGLASSSFYKLICPILGVGCVRAVVSGRKFRSKTNFINLGRR